MAINTPNAPGSPNQQAFANLKIERVTGVTGTTIPFTNVVNPNCYILFKNGTLVDTATVTPTGSALVLGTAAISSDVFHLHYAYRSG